MALPTSNLTLTQIANNLGVAKDLRVCCNSANVNKNGLNPTYCPGADANARIANLKGDMKMSYFKGYEHSKRFIKGAALNITGINTFPLFTRPVVIAANTKLLVLTIRTTSAKRNNTAQAAPTLGSTSFTQAGNYYMSYQTEIWYIIYPPTGTLTLSIPTDYVLQVSLIEYTCFGDVYFVSANIATGNSLSMQVSTATHEGVESLLVDALATGWAAGAYYWQSETDSPIFQGIQGSAASTACQYRIYYSTMSYYTMGWNLLNPMPWHLAIACFKSV